MLKPLEVTRTWTGADNKQYKLIDGIIYNADTPDNLIRILQILAQNGTRVHIYFGNSNIGTGYIKVCDKNLRLVSKKNIQSGLLIRGHEDITKITRSIKPYNVYYTRTEESINDFELILSRIIEISEEVDDIE